MNYHNRLHKNNFRFFSKAWIGKGDDLVRLNRSLEHVLSLQFSACLLKQDPGDLKQQMKEAD